MKKVMLIALVSLLTSGTAFAQANEEVLNPYRAPDKMPKEPPLSEALIVINEGTNRGKTFYEMNRDEQAMVSLSFMSNSSSDPHQRMIQKHRKILGLGDNMPSPVAYSGLSKNERAAVVYQTLDDATAPINQMQAARILARPNRG